METLFSQVQQFNQGVAQLWQDQLGRWAQAAELSGKLGRAWLDQCHELYARWRVAEDGSAPTPRP